MSNKEQDKQKYVIPVEQPNGIIAEVIVSQEEFIEWLKKVGTVDVTKTEYGVICDARIGE